MRNGSAVKFSLFLLCCAIPLRGNWSLLNNNSGATFNGTSVSVTTTSTTSGSTVLFRVAFANTLVSGSPSCTGATCSFTLLASKANGAMIVYLYCQTNFPASVTAISANSNGTDDIMAGYEEFSGGTCTGDGSAVNSQAAATTLTSGSVTTANAADLIMTAWAVSNCPTFTGPTNSFNDLNARCSAIVAGRDDYRIVSSTGTYSTGYTLASSESSADYIVALKAAVVAGVRHNCLLLGVCP